MNILAIPGSLRRDSLNRRLLQAAASLAPATMRIRLYDDLAAMPMFNEDTEARMQAAGPVRTLRDAVAAADGLLIATPEYNQSMPGVLKNAIDWLSRPAPEEVLVGKPVAVIGATAGRWGTRLAQAALRQTLFATEAIVLPGPALYLAGGSDAFDDAGLADAAHRATLQKVLDALGAQVEAARGTADRAA